MPPTAKVPVKRAGATRSQSAGTAPRPSDPDFMLSLARGLSVIRAFGDGRARLSITEVARTTGLSRAAARRCRYTLSVLGYAASNDGIYELTPAMLVLGYSYLSSASLARVAQRVLERVAADLNESASLAVLDGDEIVYLARAATRRILSIGLAVGSRLPAASTSMGRILLAFADDATRMRYLARVRLTKHTPRTIVDRAALAVEISRVRELGYAVVDQELELGLRSLAVPVRGHDGIVVAAVNVGVQAARADRAALVREFLPVLGRAAVEIGRTLGPGA